MRKPFSLPELFYLPSLDTNSNSRFFPVLLCIAILLAMASQSCSDNSGGKEDREVENKPEVVINKRADGTISSINEVDEAGIVNGRRITYYADGKSVYSKIIYKHGVKDGPASWYHKNGRVALQLHYVNGKMEGPSKRYYLSGQLLAETRYADDHPLPGLKEYDMDGNLITEYAEVTIRENLSQVNRGSIIIELNCSRKSDGVKFYYLEEENGQTNRVYLISENGSAVKRISLLRGQVINQDLRFLVEIPTDLGNTLVKELSYHLDVRGSRAKTK